MKRHAYVTEILPENLEKYTRLHANPWPGVLRAITAANITNYSIHLRKFDDGRHYLFTYYEYVGEDFAADMAEIAKDEETQRWWAECIPCLTPFAGQAPGDCWASMEEVFYHA